MPRSRTTPVGGHGPRSELCLELTGRFPDQVREVSARPQDILECACIDELQDPPLELVEARRFHARARRSWEGAETLLELSDEYLAGLLLSTLLNSQRNSLLDPSAMSCSAVVMAASTALGPRWRTCATRSFGLTSLTAEV